MKNKTKIILLLLIMTNLFATNNFAFLTNLKYTINKADEYITSGSNDFNIKDFSLKVGQSILTRYGVSNLQQPKKIIIKLQKIIFKNKKECEYRIVLHSYGYYLTRGKTLFITIDGEKKSFYSVPFLDKNILNNNEQEVSYRIDKEDLLKIYYTKNVAVRIETEHEMYNMKLDKQYKNYIKPFVEEVILSDKFIDYIKKNKIKEKIMKKQGIEYNVKDEMPKRTLYQKLLELKANITKKLNIKNL